VIAASPTGENRRADVAGSTEKTCSSAGPPLKRVKNIGLAIRQPVPLISIEEGHRPVGSMGDCFSPAQDTGSQFS